jgi:hypothetical protein
MKAILTSILILICSGEKQFKEVNEPPETIPNPWAEPPSHPMSQNIAPKRRIPSAPLQGLLQPRPRHIDVRRMIVSHKPRNFEITSSNEIKCQPQKKCPVNYVFSKESCRCEYNKCAYWIENANETDWVVHERE